MIYAFTGKTGSGKTFQMVKIAFKYWKHGIDIFSNTVLCFNDKFPRGNFDIETTSAEFSFFEKIRYQTRKTILKLLKRQIDPMSIPRRGKIVYFTGINEIIEAKNGIILFDEAQTLFNARNWEALPYEFQYKLQQHRKHNLDLFCTCQNMGTIDITYRRLVHSWYHCEEIYSMNFPFFWGIFRLNCKDVDQLYNQIDDLKAETISSKNFLIHKWKKRLYDTLYDVGFKCLKIQYLTTWDEKEKKSKKKVFIIPKQMTLPEALRLYTLTNSQLTPRTYRNYTR